MSTNEINLKFAASVGLSNNLDFCANPILVLVAMNNRPEGIQGFLDFCCDDYLSEFGFISINYMLDMDGDLALAAINYLNKR